MTEQGQAAAAADHGSALLEVDGLSAGYFDTRVLDGVSFTVKEPAVYVVLGRNGAGKTTLFRALAGILEPTAGRVAVGGHSALSHEGRRRLHYLTHIDGIPDGLRVEEALAFWARVERASPEAVEAAIKLLDLEELRSKFFSKLSQGQKKRVAVARVFLSPRDLYLLDEPTANLDPKLAHEIRDIILKLGQDKAVLYSSHNLFEAREIGRFVLALRDGKVGFFGRLSDLHSLHYRVGIRATAPVGDLTHMPREGEYYVQELAGPDEVPKLVRDLVSQGVEVREVKELGNPLEDLFE